MKDETNETIKSQKLGDRVRGLSKNHWKLVRRR